MPSLALKSLMVLSGPALAFAAVPAVAADFETAPTIANLFGGPVASESWNHGRHRGRHRGWDGDRGYEGGYGYRQEPRYYDEPIYRNTPTWRGDDGRYYCRHRDGTTGLIIGGAAGALIGREVAGPYGDRTLGTIIGAAGGALLGRAVDRGGSRCR